MIANKKTKDQMTNDLNLFLGKNSVIFTDWVHGVLERLQTISQKKVKSTKEHSSTESVTSKDKKLSKSEKGSSSNEKIKESKKREDRKDRHKTTVDESVGSKSTKPDSHEKKIKQDEKSKRRHIEKANKTEKRDRNRGTNSQSGNEDLSVVKENNGDLAKAEIYEEDILSTNIDFDEGATKLKNIKIAVYHKLISQFFRCCRDGDA